MYPFSQGEPGSMTAVRDPTAATYRRIAAATNSGPVSDLTKAGTPRSMHRSVRTSMTSAEERVLRTRIDRLSRVNLSSTRT